MLKKIYRSLISTFYKLKFADVGKGTFIAKKLQLKNGKYIKIGEECYLGKDCRIEAWDNYNGISYEPEIVFGSNVKINSRCHIGAINKIIIGDNCLFGSNVMIIDHNHGDGSIEECKNHPSDRNLYSKGPIVIGERCWICENVVILSNVKIGSGTTIGANSVVTRDLPENCIAAGVPAKVIKRK